MVKVHYKIVLEKFAMKVKFIMISVKEKENFIIKTANITLGNSKMIYIMVKVRHIIKMERLYTKAILLMANMKEMEKVIMKMVTIT